MSTHIAALPLALLYNILRYVDVATIARCEISCKQWQRHGLWRCLERLTLMSYSGDVLKVLARKSSLALCELDASHSPAHAAHPFAKRNERLTHFVAAFTPLTDNLVAWSLSSTLQVLQLQRTNITDASVILICKLATNLRGLGLFSCPRLELSPSTYECLANCNNLFALLLPKLSHGWKILSKSTSLFFLAAQGVEARNLTQPTNFLHDTERSLSAFANDFPLGVGINFRFQMGKSVNCLASILDRALYEGHYELAVACASSPHADLQLETVKYHTSLFSALLRHYSCTSFGNCEVIGYRCSCDSLYSSPPFCPVRHTLRYLDTPPCLPPLHWAVANMDDPPIMWFLEHAALFGSSTQDILNTRDQYGRTPLFYVRNDRALRLLLQYGANIHITDYSGNTALQLVCARTVCKPTRPLPSGVSSLFVLMLERFPYKLEHDILRLIFGEATLLKFAERNLKQLVAIAPSSHGRAVTGILIAFEALYSLVLNLNPYKPTRILINLLSSFCNDENLKSILREYMVANRNLSDTATRPYPLHNAVEKRRPELVKVLLEIGLSAREYNDRGLTPLHSLCVSTSANRILPTPAEVQIFKLLIAYGADINVGTLQSADVTPISLAIRSSLYLLGPMLHEGAQINDEDTSSKEPLLLTLVRQSRHLHCIYKFPMSISALTITDDSLAIRALLAGARWDLVSQDTRETALMVACSMCRVDLVRWILKAALRFTTNANQEEQVWHEIVDRVRQHVNCADQNGNTALHRAVEPLISLNTAQTPDIILDATAAIITMLAFCGADTTVKNAHDETPWDLCQREKLVGLLPEDVEEWLSGHNAGPSIIIRGKQYLLS